MNQLDELSYRMKLIAQETRDFWEVTEHYDIDSCKIVVNSCIETSECEVVFGGRYQSDTDVVIDFPLKHIISKKAANAFIEECKQKYAERLEAKKKQQQKVDEHQEKRELAEYKRLKEKYGDV